MIMKFLRRFLPLVLFLHASTVLALNKDPKQLWELAALGSQPAVTQVNLYGFNGGVPATFETEIGRAHV